MGDLQFRARGNLSIHFAKRCHRALGFIATDLLCKSNLPTSRGILLPGIRSGTHAPRASLIPRRERLVIQAVELSVSELVAQPNI